METSQELSTNYQNTHSSDLTLFDFHLFPDLTHSFFAGKPMYQNFLRISEALNRVYSNLTTINKLKKLKRIFQFRHQNNQKQLPRTLHYSLSLTFNNIRVIINSNLGSQSIHDNFKGSDSGQRDEFKYGQVHFFGVFL